MVLDEVLGQRRKTETLESFGDCINSSELKWVKDVVWDLSSIGPLVYVEEHWDLPEWTQPQSSHPQLIVIMVGSV